METKKPRLIIDTDVGTDCDDLFALTYAIVAMKKGEIDIKAITTCQEKNQVRAKIVRKLERILEVDIPIFSGTEASNRTYIKKGVERNSYCGFEHLALSEEELKELIKELAPIVYEDGDILVGIGPLTNMASQLKTNETIRNVKEIYLMGLNEDSHNFKIDLDATNEVLQAKWKKYLVTSEVSKNVLMVRADLEKLRENKLGEFLADSAVRWMNFSGKTELKMYDVLAVSAAMNEGYVRFFQNHTRAISDYVNPTLKEKLMEVIQHAS
jgi:inosine-uridine nucleoside N-ribohydrolase